MMKKKDNIIGTRIGLYNILYECDFKSNDGHKMYHIQCVECGWETDMQKSHIGNAQKCTHIGKLTQEQLNVWYEKNKKKCLQCEGYIQFDNISFYQYHEKKFCSLSCAASYNNRFTKKKHGEKFCLNCGALLPKYSQKYCSHECQFEYQQKQWEEKWLSGEISGFYETNHWGNTPDRIKTYLFNKFNSKCSICGWGEINPFTGRIPLEVEHIDGNYKNNRPENLTLLCPNCHSLTETYRGANRGRGRGKTWTPISE